MGNSGVQPVLHRSKVPYVLALLACASCGSSPVSVASSPLGAHWVDVLQSLAQTGLDSTAIDESVLEMLPSSDVKASYQVRTPQRASLHFVRSHFCLWAQKKHVWAHQLQPARVRNGLLQDNVKTVYSHLEEIIAKILAHKKA